MPSPKVYTLALLVAVVGSTGCTYNCDNAGVSVDGRGNIVVRGKNGFISPNSTILRNVSEWPQPPGDEENFTFTQGYTLTRDGAMYVLENTAQHPNLVYRVDLATGGSSTIGPTSGVVPGLGSMAKSNETWIAAGDRSAYSVDQTDAVIRRADLSTGRPVLTPFIAGPRTQLHAPIAVAVDATERLCVLDSRTNFLLCYQPKQSGNIAPQRAVDLKKLLGYAQVQDLIFDRSGHVVVSGTSDYAGVGDFSIAVVDVTGGPRVVRTLSGPNTRLFSPRLAVDALGNILVLQRDSPDLPSGNEILAFGPGQKGNVAAMWVRDPAATVTHPFRIAVDQTTNDVAILGSDGVALFRGAADRPPTHWAAEIRLPARGWSVAYGADSLIVADQFGGIEKHGVRQGYSGANVASTSFNLRDPEFISTDQDGAVYAASTDGVITAFPVDSQQTTGWKSVSFAATFGRNVNAFAADTAGYFYLSSASNNAILTRSPRGEQSVISGTKTNLNDPLGLAVNREGLLFVANAGARSILVFARGASGDVAPLGKIVGRATALVAPQALAIDAGGKLYVFDGPQRTVGVAAAHYVRVYDAAARGDASPLRTYAVQTKCWMNAP